MHAHHCHRRSRARTGLSIAKVFGSHGFTAALISRNESKLGALVAQLAESGTTAAAYPATSSFNNGCCRCSGRLDNCDSVSGPVLVAILRRMRWTP
jgi:hypothetical protein